jgi:hypothetical protein
MNPTPDERHERLAPVIEAYRKVPFAWNIHDCVLLAARCVDAQIGTRLEYNIQRDFHYTGAVPAIRIVIEAGGWESLISRYLGPSAKPSEIEFGDVVLAHAMSPFERTSVVGICDEELIIVPGTQRLEWLPMANALMGWKLERIPKRWVA